MKRPFLAKKKGEISSTLKILLLHIDSPLGTLFILDDKKNHHNLEKVSVGGGHIAIKTSFKKLGGFFCSQNWAATDTSGTRVVFAPTPRKYSCIHLAFS